MLRCDEKNLREYRVPNVCGVIITTNYKTDGIYLPADDRRHYVAWSHLTAQDFDAGYFDELYAWFEREGCRHVAAYLSALVARRLQPQGAAAEDAGLLGDRRRQSRLGGKRPRRHRRQHAPADRHSTRTASPSMAPIRRSSPSTRLPSTRRTALAEWLRDPRNRRMIPKRFEKIGYVRVLNDDADDKLWKIGGRRQAVYGRFDVSLRERLAAVRERISRGAESVKSVKSVVRIPRKNRQNKKSERAAK